MERIEGMISDIVFKNEDNGYTIAHLANSDNEIVIVGCMPTLSVGESIEVEGKWVNHKTYGTQFEVEKFMPITPSSLEGIYVYLSSGMIHGIGEKMAKRIVDKFGVDTLNVIQNAPERLKEVEGIGSKKIDQIVKSYEENRELRNIIIELSPYGITPNYCMRIYKKYKNKAILFSAPSGTGKSTQADLWEKYENAEIINGDRSGIRKMDGKWTAYGLPIAGSSGIYKNKKAEISHIIVLKQGKENKLTKLSQREAFIKLYSETLVHTWDKKFQENIINMITDVVQNVQIYQYECLPDKSAVDFLKNQIIEDRGLFIENNECEKSIK